MQKIKKVSLSTLLRVYSHPSAALYRALELKQLYRACKGISFKGPSLDIGSGDGVISTLLFDHHFTYGVDNGEANDYLESIKHKRYSKVFLESADKMSLTDNSVNFAFSNSVLEHIPNLSGVLKETSRVMNSGGYFVFTTPSKYFRRNIYIDRGLNKIGLGWINTLFSKLRNSSLNHYNLYDHKYYQRELNKYHFKVIKHSYSISSKTLRLWDRMALKIKLFKFIGLNLEKSVLDDNHSAIETIYKRETITKNRGSNLLIIAKKV